MNRKQIKLQARTTVQKNLVMAAALFIIPVAVQSLVSMALGWLGGFGGFLAGIVTFVISAFTSVGYAKGYLRLHREGKGELNDLIYGVNKWERTIMLGVWYWLFTLAWTLVPMVVIILASTIGGISAATTNNGLLASLAVLIVLVASIAISLLGFFIQIRYGFAAYLLIEEPTLDPKACISESKRMVQGHYRELIMFYLSFFGWFVLSAFTFGIVGLFAIPYIFTAYAGVYDDFRKRERGVTSTVTQVPNPTPPSGE
ncbi:MAG: DUF975 family protein [Culicoidibacterales bacterium]